MDPQIREERKQFMINFYELDHKLSRDKRIALRDYFNGIRTRVQLYSGLGFCAGAGTVLFLNRKTISRTRYLVKKMMENASAGISPQEFRAKLMADKKLPPQNNIGAKSALAGIGAMVFGLPLFSASAVSTATENLKKQKGEDSLEYKIADLLRANGPWISWYVYYGVTVEDPSKAVRDPRAKQPPRPIVQGRMRQQQQPVQTIEQQGYNSASSEFDSDSAATPFEQPVASLGQPLPSLGQRVSSPETLNPYKENVQPANDLTSSFGSDEDSSYWGMPVAEDTLEPQTTESTGSSWDKIRAQSGVKVVGTPGLSWDRIRKNLE